MLHSLSVLSTVKIGGCTWSVAVDRLCVKDNANGICEADTRWPSRRSDYRAVIAERRAPARQEIGDILLL